MSTELELTDGTESSSLELLPPQRPQSHNAIAVLHQHAQAMEIAHRFAVAVCNTQVCPARYYRKPDDGAAAILYGLEIGLTPSAALQKVVVIHGMPTLEARTMVALLKTRGYKIRTVEQTDERVTVQGEGPDGETAVSQWTIDRAIKAGYVPTETAPGSGKYKTNNNGKLIGNEKYLTDPQAMLKAKAQAEVCRDLAPDVLLGISYSSEELESERWDNAPAPQRSATSAPVTVDELFAEEVAAAEPEPAPASVDEPEVQGDELPVPTAVPLPLSDEPQANERPAEVQAAVDAAAAKTAHPKKAPAKRSTSKVRAPLEKRLFALLGDANIDDDRDNDDQLAVYRSIVERPDVESLDELDDVEVGKVCDQLYRWQTDKQLVEKVDDILDTAAAALFKAANPSIPTTTEGQ